MPAVLEVHRSFRVGEMARGVHASQACEEPLARMHQYVCPQPGGFELQGGFSKAAAVGVVDVADRAVGIAVVALPEQSHHRSLEPSCCSNTAIQERNKSLCRSCPSSAATEWALAGARHRFEKPKLSRFRSDWEWPGLLPRRSFGRGRIDEPRHRIRKAPVVYRWPCIALPPFAKIVRKSSTRQSKRIRSARSPPLAHRV
jgi:hypothetical protein